MKDDAIVALFFERNEDALTCSKREYEGYCKYIANNLLHSAEDAEECFNDVLLAAWNSIPPQKPECLKSYLGKLTRNIAVDLLRNKDAQKRVPPENVAPFDELEAVIGENDVDETVGEKELSLLISAFLRTQKEEARNIFIRRYWYYDPIDSICERFGCKRSKVLVTLKRTRDKLAVFLKKEGYLR